MGACRPRICERPGGVVTSGQSGISSLIQHQRLHEEHPEKFQQDRNTEKRFSKTQTLGQDMVAKFPKVIRTAFLSPHISPAETRQRRCAQSRGWPGVSSPKTGSHLHSQIELAARKLPLWLIRMKPLLRLYDEIRRLSALIKLHLLDRHRSRCWTISPHWRQTFVEHPSPVFLS